MGRSTWLRNGLAAAIPWLATSPSAAMTGVSFCDPGPEAEKVLRQAREMGESCVGSECLARKKGLLEAAIDRDPGDVFLHREYQDVVRPPRPDDPPEAARMLVDYYEARLGQEPERPLWLYLYGRALIFAGREQEAFDLSRRAAEGDPGFPWAHLTLTYFYVTDEKRQNQAKAREHIEAFVRLCPDAPEIYTYMARVPSFERTGPTGLRALLERRVDARTLPYFQSLWRAEFRLTPPGEHETVRARVRGDVERLRASPLRDRLEWWKTLAQAYQLAGDEPGRVAVQREMVASFPCRDESAWVRRELYEKDHPTPAAGDVHQRTAHARSWFEAAGEWVKQCPESVDYSLDRLASARELDELSNEEFRAISESFQRLWERPDRRGSMTPLPYFMIAESYVSRGMSLDQVEELLRKAEQEFAVRAARQLARPGLSNEARSGMDEERGHREWQGLLIRARAALKRRDVETAGHLVAKLATLLDAQTPKQDAGATEKRRHRWRRGEYWKLKAEQAAAAGRRGDALAFYRKALSDRPEDTDLEEAAHDLWREIGGTDDGWNALADLERTPGIETAQGASVWETGNHPLADFDLRDATGTRWTREDLAGKVAFINVWATWCGPCLLELPYVQKLNERLKERAEAVLLTLNVDENPGVVGPYLALKGYRFPALLATDWFQEKHAERSIPQNWLVDPAGVVRFERVGFAPNEGDRWLEDVLVRLADLAKSKAAADPPER